MEDESCPMCPHGVGNLLGILGTMAHYRCRDCGWDFSNRVEAEEVFEEDDSDPMEDEEDDPFHGDHMAADADALASAGYGTDEDYGYFGGNED